MKKIKLIIICTLLFTVLPIFNQAEAATVPYYAKPSFVKQMKKGTPTFEGITLGKKVGDYVNKKGYKIQQRLMMPNNSNYFLKAVTKKDSWGAGHYQDNISLTKRKINYIYTTVYGKTYTRAQMQKVYGKPIYSEKTGLFDSRGYVDYYKNFSFQYYIDWRPDRISSEPKLIVIMARTSPDVKTINKWRKVDHKYGQTQGNLYYITKKEWDSL